MPLNFAERFCTRFNLPREAYCKHALARALFPHARLLRPVIDVFAPGFFATDRELIANISYLGTHSSFDIAAHQFATHPDNHRFLRRSLRLRASLRRTQHLLRQATQQRAAPPAPASRAPAHPTPLSTTNPARFTPRNPTARAVAKT